MTSWPAARGSRLPWRETPLAVQSWAEASLGGPIVQATDQPTGFSPGAAARLLTSDGHRAFVKAASAQTNAESARLHRREAAISAALPDWIPAPRFLDAYDD